MSSSVIQRLLDDRQLWQASYQNNPKVAVTTGYEALDKQLHYRGWPRAALTEILLAKNGSGEIRLLCPLLAQLSSQAGYLCWINPPFHPYAPALLQQQIDLKKLFIIKTKTEQESIWAAQQAMKSKACSMVLVWLPKTTHNASIRKLNLAAKEGNCWGFVIRDQNTEQQSSPATLRVKLQSQQARQAVSILKQPGGWSGQQVILNLFPERAYWNAKAAQSWPKALTSELIQTYQYPYHLTSKPKEDFKATGLWSSQSTANPLQEKPVISLNS